MRAPKNEATGTSGETEVLAEFEALGWGGVIDARHDTGTDLYLRPRDARRFELGVMMGAQVKTGSSYFKSPEKDANDTIVGWWFSHNHIHFNYWLRHALPHILVLRDNEEKCSYWVHITEEAVTFTNKTAKILVPAKQIVNKEQNEALSDVALTQRPAPTWNGTAWTGAVHLSPEDEVRHALITPRLIAPHLNLGSVKITGIEALAMQVLFREDLERIFAPPKFSTRFEERGLTLDAARQSQEWTWRAAAALHLWQYQAEDTELCQLVDAATTPFERAAAFALQCVYFFDRSDPDAVLEKLTEAFTHDDYSPVDHAWLEAQHARALLEVGELEEAFDLAMKTQRIYQEAPFDVTAAAIAGTCASTAFRSSGWMQGNVANFVEHADNPATWWRSQTLSSGLSRHLSEEFRSWSEDPSERLGYSDPVRKDLLSAALTASFAGDQRGWCNATAMRAAHLLVNATPLDDPEVIAYNLDLLRRSGDSGFTKNAVSHIIRRGPATAAKIAASSVSLPCSTRTTAAADLELLTAAGDVLEPWQADEVCSWALATLQDSQAYLSRTRPTFNQVIKLINLLKSIVCSISQRALHTMVNYLLSQPPITDDSTAQTLARLVHAIPDDAWRESDRLRAASRAEYDGAYLKEAFLRVAAPTVDEARDQIFQRACAGDLNIFDAIDDVRELPTEAVNALSDQLCDSITNLIEDAKNNRYAEGGLDPGETLNLLNVWHPSSARWDYIEDLFTTPQVLSKQQSGALRVFAVYGENLDSSVRERFLSPVEALRSKEPTTFHPLFIDSDIRHLAAEALAALVDDNFRSLLVRDLLSCNSIHRAVAARIVERFGDRAETELLLALAGDRDKDVRDAALLGLSRLAKDGRAPEAVMATLSNILSSGGVKSAAAVISRLQGKPETKEASELLTIATNHPSAWIRKKAHLALGDQSEPSSN